MQTRSAELVVLRHGETEWSRTGRHTGRTDVPLTTRGEEQGRALAPALARRRTSSHTLVSPAARARRTAQLAGLDAAEVDARLWEWDYGGYEGRTTEEIQREHPGWYLWSDGVIPGDRDHPGESIEQVGARVDTLLADLRERLEDGDVAVVAHGHVLRVLTARWLGLEPAAGRLFRLGTGTLSVLGTEHGRPVITAWNTPAGSGP
ncbi:histidine phosphatase family protein [Myceligenerans pegani]|uniref:Histidine phosphatase family protein n=1 Tax=Myceligenerans pegani TaxID=2776917 RepID=A0ABR9N3V0_9MICO|nr:histidine phosphatase family protein [Myceligenerans sp. TRM 65318]MBE1878341.1 histidine phosphatase family protein [Myceligenerans sp. TRM 65318]MBE3020612.1 histidine phosphatase family protein [Myceligenerans sp. TRM 65318]